MSKKITIILLVLLLSLIVSVSLVAVNFNMVKGRYHEIEPNLDNYSAGEILSLSFEKARTALLLGDYDDYLIKTKVIGSKIKILESRATLSDTFYHSEEFLKDLDKLKVQYNRLKELNLKLMDNHLESSVILGFMDLMDSTIIELLEVIYKIQISNFNEVKDIIDSNLKKAEWFSFLSLFLGFLMIFVVLCDVFYLRDLLRKKNLFISSIYHELASSAQTIVMSADIVESEIQQDELRDEVKRISHHTDKIIEQTKEIFDYSKIELGVARIHLSYFNLYDLYKDIFLSFSAKNGNVLKVQFPSGNIEIISDKYKLYRIVINLLDNANKYTVKGRIFVNFKIHNHNLVLRIRDTGEGFDIKALKGLYKAFNQGSEKMTRQGLGLGLTIVKSYVKLLRGKVRVDSRVGYGSKFLIIIPVTLTKE
ncbi:HAMP domain-containing sensor histidine kinase [Pantoea sp.]|uniref:sensor histidine kinase n=1 Tax=Pantoea sp. TaxID=69393 RepID=UPI0028A26690|nr:HAMP domain-containing sensor histidine kinase [Pantoea sp.]